MQKDPKAKELEILKSLDKSPYRDRKDQNPDRIPGTCEWFVGHELFRDWQQGSSSRMLWVSADPGCGKSVLAKYLVDSILPTTESRTTCYFFFKDDFEDQRTVVNALCCILLQLFRQKRILLSEMVLKRLEVDGDKFTNSFSELWDTLLGAAEDKNAGEIVCLLDAIDECENRGRVQLTRALCKLYGTQRDFNLKFLLTSRPYFGIRRVFQPLNLPGLPAIHLSGESDIEVKKISREIGVFIKARVDDIGARLDLGYYEQDYLLQVLMRVPNRTYLWVHLTLDFIESDIDIDNIGIVNATSRLPKAVDEAYNRILSKSRNSEKAQRILHIVIGAVRPLTLGEMALALGIRENHQSYNDLDLKSEDSFRESIRDTCGLLVTTIDSRIYLLHETVKEFLVQKDQEIHHRNDHRDLKWKHSLRQRDSHRILAEICMRHLLFAELEACPQDAMLSQYLESHVFLDYSAEHWTTHLHESHIEVEHDNGTAESMLKLCDASSKRCRTWFRIYWTSTKTSNFPESFTTLMIASYFGLATVMKRLLTRLGNIDLDDKDSTYGRSALSWAAGNGFDRAVKILIEGIGSFKKGAQVDSVDRYGRTPLVYAVWNRHVAVIKLLLGAGASISLTDDIGGSPLSYAVCSEHDDVLKPLVEKGANVDTEGGFNIRVTLLLSAAKKGDESVIRLLLETGKVNLDLEDENRRTLLSWAVEKGHEAVVRVLLETGKVNPDLKDLHNETPLLWAATKGQEAMVKLLIETGKANPDVKAANNQTPLSRAVEGGNVAVVQLLLARGVELDYTFTVVSGPNNIWMSLLD
jgi:ankyrin repeat domain-containing protein 50